MCGIGGLTGVETRLHERAETLCRSLVHRGPDDHGSWFNEATGTAFVQTRLSILDLSPAGHQPMYTDDGRFIIVFNGEIYNFQELRQELIREGVHFKSHSDTEVLLHGFARHGAAIVDRLAGMFAFAVWDNAERKLFLARDPLGIKPLYFWHHGRSLAFASEVKALLSTQLTVATLDPDALMRFLLLGSVQEPDTLVSGVTQLAAGHYAEFDGKQLRVTRYWTPRYGNGTTPDSEAPGFVRGALLESLKRHYVSDVPVGLFLSGGIDSTAVLALAKAVGQTDLRTFCISFDDPSYNEGEVAAKTAQHFGTEHHDWRMTSEDGQSLIHDFVDAMDLPSNDGFNTFCVSKFAHSHGLKVVLSGLGGDEMFGGYPSFERVPQWVRLHKYLGPARYLAAACLDLSAKVGATNTLQTNRMNAFLRSRGGYHAAYWMSRAFFTPLEAVKIVHELTGKSPTDSDGGVLTGDGDLPGEGDEVGHLETTKYMRNQLLRDSDVMSMAHGLELRVPFVDRRLVDSVTTLSPAIRIRKNKQLLLDAVPEVPDWVKNRAKQGFRFPFETWVNNQWKDRFKKVEESTPVPLGKWYRKWTIFALRHFIERNELA